VGLLAAALVVLAGGCATGTDDELAPKPTKTVTATPSQSVAPAPATIPVGQGDVSPTDVVWAQGSVLHVNGKEVDLAPMAIDAFVVVPGGVFVLDDGEVWFTDLSRVRGTAQTDVTGMQVSADASRLQIVDNRSGHRLEQGYDTRTGKAVRGVVDTQTPEEQRKGPGRFAVTTTSAGAPSVVEAATGDHVRINGTPNGFRLGAWAGDSVFYGVGRDEVGQARHVVRCDVVARACSRLDRVSSNPVVFGTGR
jgi:hypothetical protein